MIRPGSCSLAEIFSLCFLKGSPSYQSLHVWIPQWNLLHSAVPASRPDQDPPANAAEQHAAWVSLCELNTLKLAHVHLYYFNKQILNHQTNLVEKENHKHLFNL